MHLQRGDLSMLCIIYAVQYVFYLPLLFLTQCYDHLLHTSTQVYSVIVVKAEKSLTGGLVRSLALTHRRFFNLSISHKLYTSTYQSATTLRKVLSANTSENTWVDEQCTVFFNHSVHRGNTGHGKDLSVS